MILSLTSQKEHSFEKESVTYRIEIFKVVKPGDKKEDGSQTEENSKTNTEAGGPSGQLKYKLVTEDSDFKQLKRIEYSRVMEGPKNHLFCNMEPGKYIFIVSIRSKFNYVINNQEYMTLVVNSS